MATSPEKTAVASLERTAEQDLAGLAALMAPDIVMRFPFAPPGIPNSCQGKEACLEMAASIFSMLDSFEFLDLEGSQTTDPELVFVTGRSRAKAANGNAYANEYFFKIRVREGLIVEHEEYFSPLPIMAAFSGTTDAV